MANKNQTVEVIRNYTSFVGEFNISRIPGGILVEGNKDTLLLPNGAAGRAILTEALSFVTDEAPVKGKKAPKAKDGASPAKRTRRTKAEMEAARLAESSAPVATVGNTTGEDEELEVV